MASIHDVAKLAGVSIKTVSRVINNEQSVREATRVRVQEVIDKLQYTPHSGARLMRSGRSNLVGLVTSTISTVSRDPHNLGLSSIHIVKGIQRICREANKTLLIIDTEPDADDIKSSIDILRSHRVDGIFYVLDYHRYIESLKVTDTPCWLVNGYSLNNTPAVVPDDFAGQVMAVEYLVNHGHRRLGYIGLSREIEAGRLRYDAFTHAVRDFGLSQDEILIEEGMKNGLDNSFSVLSDAIDRLLSHEIMPTAICFGNDKMAYKAIPFLKAKGLRIPEDISIMGYDNDIATAASARPRLTTVALPYQRIGHVAAKEMLQQLQDPIENSHNNSNYPIKVKGEVVTRESVRSINNADNVIPIKGDIVG